MNLRHLGRLGAVVLLCVGGISLALFLLLSPAQRARALDGSIGVVKGLFANTSPDPTASPLVPPEESLLMSEEPDPAESSSWPSFPISLLGLLCLLPLCLILAMVVIWRRIRRTSADKNGAALGKTAVLNVPEPELPAKPYLRHRGMIWELQASQTLGRDSQTTRVITEAMTGWQTVSAMHAEISRQQDRWVIKDLNSLNGIYINGIRTGHNLLKDGDKLRLGAVEFIFCTGEQAVQQ
ncbi:MAG: FHA domain protein [Chloroflexi bacterium ADurb.Bin360]|nr:MAG: FHA domain protein [Chloroflexi bacterium ADurb.Bin360]